jgi:hypothetical protein
LKWRFLANGVSPKFGLVRALLAKVISAKAARARPFRACRIAARAGGKRAKRLRCPFWFAWERNRRLEFHWGPRFFAQFGFNVAFRAIGWAVLWVDGSFRACAGSAFNSGAKLFDLFRQQVTKFARMNIQRERAVADALQLFDMVASLLEHGTDLAVAALNERDLIPGVFGLVDELNSRWSGSRRDSLAVRQGNASAKLLNGGIAGLSAHFHKIRFWNMGRSLCQCIGKLTVVGEQQETFAGIVQTADGVDALFDTAQEVDNGRAAFGVAQRGDVTFRFIEQDVNVVAGELEQLSIDADVVLPRVGLSAEFGYGLTVDLNQARRNKLFGFAAGGNTCGGNNFLQTFHGKALSVVPNYRAKIHASSTSLRAGSVPKSGQRRRLVLNA